MGQKRPLTFIIAVVLFFTSGFISSYVFHEDDNDLMTKEMFLGLLFIVASLLVFLLSGIRIKIIDALKYSLAMYLGYLVIYYGTLFSSYAGFILGMLTGGIGAILTFYLTNRFIKRVTYSNRDVFIIGALAFLINNILLINPIADLIEPIYKIQGYVHTVFAPTFLFWNLFVGIKLHRTISDE